MGDDEWLNLSLPKTQIRAYRWCSPPQDRVRDDVSERLDRACIGRIFFERDVSSHLVIIAGVFRKNAPKVPLAQHDQMITALASDRPDQALNISILPGRAERRGTISDTHRTDAGLECSAECSVIVADEILRRAVPRKCFSDLARQPLGRRMAGHRKPQ
jgi:hypothetical protein